MALRVSAAEFSGHEFDVEFPIPVTDRCETLLSFGVAGAGDVFFVRYSDGNRVQIGWERTGADRVLSPPVQMHAGQRCRLRVATGLEASVAPWTEVVAVELDQQPLLRLRRSAPVPPPDARWFLGSNRVGGSVGLHGFRGKIAAAGGWPASAIAKLMDLDAQGPLRLTVRFPTQRPGRSEPLLVTGRTGAGDAVYVKFEEPGRIRLGIDHWGSGGGTGGIVVIPPDDQHELWISTDALLPETLPGLADDWESLRGKCVVMCDGRLIFETELRAHAASAKEIYVGRNPIGISTCDPTFTGEITLGAPLNPQEMIHITRRPRWSGERELTADFRTQPGPLRIEAVLRKDQSPGSSDPFVCTGANGAGDLLALRFESPAAARFVLDHWGSPLREGRTFQTLPGQKHEVLVSTGALLPPPQAGLPDPFARLRSRVVVMIDGEVVLDASADFFESTPKTFSIGVNRIGATTAHPTFRGAIEKIEPAPTAAFR